MLLQVQNLSKFYGQFQALKEISFSINQGEIVGFLGANGAGKSTTMQILSGCLAPTSGQVSLLGKDIQAHPIWTKKQIGYLPENAPLYPQMKVIDYLDFVGAIKNISSKEDTENIIRRLKLESVAQRFIDQLSKGYKQRVGLAQALLHTPKLLILDEPTSGLDPAQRSELRELLLSLKNEGHAILLSTHILSEVEASCDRVIIISQGKIKSTQDIRSLHHHQLQLQVGDYGTQFEAELLKLDNISILSQQDSRYLLNTSPEQVENIAKIAAKYRLRYLAPHNALEELYLQVTGEKE